MKRPLAVIGFTYFAASAVALLLDEGFCIIFIGVAALLSVLSICLPFLREHSAVAAVCMTTMAAMLGVLIFNGVYISPVDNLHGKKAVVTGTICELPYRQNDRYYYKLDTERIEAENVVQHTKILMSSVKKIDADAFDTVKATVYFYPPSDDSYRFYQISRRNYLCGSIDTQGELRVFKNYDKPIFFYALMLRKTMSHIIEKELPKDCSDFVSALLLGEKNLLSSDKQEAFRSAGLSHIIVVSGYHLSVITNIMLILLQFLTGGRKRVAGFICPVFVFAYMAVAGFTPSVVRAGIMLILYLFAASAIVKTDTLNSLGLAALIICFLNPYTALDIGFILSFFSTAGIAVVHPVLYGKIIGKIYPVDKECRKWIKMTEYPVRAFFSVMTVSASAILFTTPFILFFFKSFALYALLSNLMVSFGVSVLIICSFLMVLSDMSRIFPFFTSPLALLCEIMARYVINAVNIVGNMPLAVIKLSGEYVPVCILISAVIVTTIVSFWNGKRSFMAVVCAFAVIGTFSIGTAVEYEYKKDSVKLEIIDCGEGITVVMTESESTAVLSCGGSEGYTRLTSYLNDLAVNHVDYLLIHDRKEEVSAFAEKILKTYEIGTVHIFEEERQKKTLLSMLGNADKVISGKNGSIETVYLPKTAVSVYHTNSGTAIYFELYSKKILVCTSGINCGELLPEWYNTDILICDGKLKNADRIHSENIILSGVSLPFRIPKIGEYYFTLNDGNIGIRFYNDESFTMRREGYWLS